MKTLIANWKMNVGIRESVALARGTLLTLRGRKLIPELVICPSSIALSEVRKIVARSSVSLGAQNVFWESSGAHTGETSTRMLQEVGVSYVILGHSERRQELGETDEMIHKKVLHVLSEQMTPIVCIGESKQQQEAGQTQEVIRTQLMNVLSSVHLRGSERVFIAYEPLWAIGSGVAASVGEVIDVHQFIRSLLQELFPGVSSQQLPLLYGGSVDGENAYGFLREELIDGLLVGGASVKINQFKDIVEACGDVLEAQGI